MVTMNIWTLSCFLY